MRAILESIKKLVDEIYAKEPQKWRGVQRMVLHPPASPAAVKGFLGSPVGKGVPESYGEFLRASDGLEQGWQRLSFLGTAPARQKPILAVIKYMRDDQAGRFKSFEGAATDTKIKAWEAKSGELFLANHPVVATSGEGDLLVYDVRPQRKAGEPPLCWWPQPEAIKERYVDISAYFEAVLREVERYHGKLKGGRKGKA